MLIFIKSHFITSLRSANFYHFLQQTLRHFDASHVKKFSDQICSPEVGCNPCHHPLPDYLVPAYLVKSQDTCSCLALIMQVFYQKFCPWMWSPWCTFCHISCPKTTNQHIYMQLKPPCITWKLSATSAWVTFQYAHTCFELLTETL